MDDYSAEEDLIAEAEVWAAEDAAVGDVESVEIDAQIIDDAATQALEDRASVMAAETVIEAACLDAAAALLTAAPIDEAEATAVAKVLAAAWIDDDEG